MTTTPQVLSLANAFVMVPNTEESYEAVVMFLDDGRYRVLDWKHDLKALGFDCIYSPDTMAWVCHIGEDMYIIEEYTHSVAFEDGTRDVDINVIIDMVLPSQPHARIPGGIRIRGTH